MAPETNSAVERLEAHAHLRQDHEESEKQEQGRKAQAFPELKADVNIWGIFWLQHIPIREACEHLTLLLPKMTSNNEVVLRAPYFVTHPFKCHNKRTRCCCSMSRARETGSPVATSKESTEHNNALRRSWHWCELRVSAPIMNITVGEGNDNYGWPKTKEATCVLECNVLPK